MAGVDGWQLSNVPIFQSAAHLAALEIFQQATMRSLRQEKPRADRLSGVFVDDFDPTRKALPYHNPKKSS